MRLYAVQCVIFTMQLRMKNKHLNRGAFLIPRPWVESGTSQKVSIFENGGGMDKKERFAEGGGGSYLKLCLTNPIDYRII